MPLLAAIEAFFRQRAPLSSGAGVLVAFSGGPDSTALLWGLSALRLHHGFPLSAFHLDHGSDPGSAGRAEGARTIAARLGVPFRSRRLEVPALRRPGEGLEEAGRRLRYEALEAERLRLGACWTATAHHRDDQAETVALRLSFGSGLEGMAGVLPRRGAVVRPLLALGRREVLEGLAGLQRARGPGEPPVEPLHDPTNDDLTARRNRWRHALLPHLEAQEPGTVARLARLGGRTEGARQALERRLLGLLAPREWTEPGRPAGVEPRIERQIEIDIAPLLALPPELVPWALAALHRLASAPHPPGGAARAELFRQLAQGGAGARPGCDCGQGWRWEARGGTLALVPPGDARRGETPPFTYTLPIPGEIEIPEISASVRISLGRVEPWMSQGARHRAAFVLPASSGDRLTVRSRRPGDRLQPLGAPGRRRLKDVLIDRRVPRSERDRIPLLCWGERIVWVPGVTVDQSFRLCGAESAWIAEITTP